MPKDLRFGPMKTRTLREDIATLLTDAVLSGKIKSGERLNESELARQLKVSRAPIREALQQLQEQGLVLNLPRRGMFVVSLDESELQKINSLRLILESEALRLAAAHLNVAAETHLAQLVAGLESFEGPAIEATHLDLQFHRAVWSLTGNEYLERTLTSLTAPLFAYAVLSRPEGEKVRMILDSHRPLLEYLQGRRSQSAEEVMCEHLSLRWKDPARYSSLNSPR